MSITNVLIILWSCDAHTPRQAQTYEALTLTIESSLELVGTLKEVPEGKTASGGHELVVDYWRVLGAAPGADDAFTNRLNEVCWLSSDPRRDPNHIDRKPFLLSWQTLGTSFSEEKPRQASSAFVPTYLQRSASLSLATTSSKSLHPVWYKRKSRAERPCSSWITMASRHFLPKALSYT